MATKKTVATVAAANVEEPKTEMKETTAKETVVKEAAEKAKAVKETVVKEKAVKQPAAKKTTAKKTTAKKAELKNELHIQFEGKSYSQEDLLKMAKDVWKYDLKQKARELTSVELYVKPEENMVYYVMNKEMTGSFYI